MAECEGTPLFSRATWLLELGIPSETRVNKGSIQEIEPNDWGHQKENATEQTPKTKLLAETSMLESVVGLGC